MLVLRSSVGKAPPYRIQRTVTQHADFNPILTGQIRQQDVWVIHSRIEGEGPPVDVGVQVEKILNDQGLWHWRCRGRRVATQIHTLDCAERDLAAGLRSTKHTDRCCRDGVFSVSFQTLDFTRCAGSCHQTGRCTVSKLDASLTDLWAVGGQFPPDSCATPPLRCCLQIRGRRGHCFICCK